MNVHLANQNRSQICSNVLFFLALVPSRRSTSGRNELVDPPILNMLVMPNQESGHPLDLEHP